MVFDQSTFVKMAISNVSREAFIGLVLAGIMVLIFLGSVARHLAVCSPVPLSALVCLLFTNAMGGSINTMLLGGLALVFSRLIDNGVIVLENIFRHMEMGKSPKVAADEGGTEVVDGGAGSHLHHRHRLFPGHHLQRRQQVHLHASGAGSGVFHLCVLLYRHDAGALYCAKFISPPIDEEHVDRHQKNILPASTAPSTQKFQAMLDWYESLARKAMKRPDVTTTSSSPA